ncbi:ABC transporter permease [Kordiimonas sp. SCSIO 12603]|uniref:ABC transporter permease n=1 Tax=Kordiimonas sp. SCSIO 12603 TaxID=2829596 RepID=UPI0021020030|nr:ABC transporter permease [Kordiimonas sp. SCSIO 12603]UTW58228.1 ABC transporter permease [Kordiimonas sp. SCSIO 12603]
MEFFADLVLLTDSTFRIATPLVLTALAGLVCERGGVVDIGLEGKMLASAFAAAASAAVTGSPWAGMAAGIGASILLALLHGYVSISQRGNQIVSGMAINIAVAGLAPTLANFWFEKGGQTPLLGDEARFSTITFPFADSLADVPVIGALYSEILSGHNIITYMTIVIVPLVAWMLYKTRFGLRLRAVGENPEAVDTAGISVTLLRYQAMVIAGVLCGLAGTVLSTGLGAGFIRDMSAGKGYLALAAMIFGKWKPVPTLLACLLFGFVDALQGRLQGVALPLIGEIPVQFTIMLPYVLTVIILAGFVGKIQAPRASGIPYEKDH